MTTHTSRRRWTEPVIEEELSTLTAKLGRFPDRKDLVAEGLRSLWEAMQRGDGVDAWRERLTGARQTADTGPAIEPVDIEPADTEQVDIEPAAAAGSSPTPTTEQIAELAYKLHEDGVEGDQLSHWLAAERLLAGN